MTKLEEAMELIRKAKKLVRAEIKAGKDIDDILGAVVMPNFETIIDSIDSVDMETDGEEARQMLKAGMNSGAA